MNVDNSLSCATHMDTFVHQIGYNINAETLLQSLLSTGTEFLDRVPDSLIMLFIKMLNERGQKQIYIDYLSKLCRYKANGIKGKQIELCQRLFTLNKNNLEYQTTILYKVGCTYENHLEVHLPTEDKWISLHEMIKNHFDASCYFMATINMLASMCCARNYISINSVERYLPRQVVLNLIKDNKISLNVRVMLYIFYISNLSCGIPSIIVSCRFC